MKKKFTWVQTHKELVEYLKTKEDSQEELIDLLKESGATVFNDFDQDGNRIDLKEIDPFTFFCYIHKYGDENRTEIFENLNKKVGVKVPSDYSGIPKANAQKVWLFPYKKHRKNNEVNRLWSFFFDTLNDSVTDEKVQDILKIKNIRETKLTEALFYVKPDDYLPINAPTKPYLKEVLGIDPNFSIWTEYLDILKQVEEKTDQPFYGLSYEAWAWNNKKTENDNKVQAFKELVDRYKQYLKEDGIVKEGYKWEAIQHFQDTIDLDAKDFAANLRGAISKANNLVYVNSLGYIRKAVEYFPEDVRKMFKELYDQAQPLEERYNTFVGEAESLLPRVIEKYGKKLNHQQDERTISFYLTMMYPDRYPLYKNETYKYLLSVLGNKQPKSAGEKFFHYLELAKQLIPAVEGDGDVIDMVEELLTEDCYHGEQKWVVFQDILWINMRSIDKVQYWLFQGNPKIFDVKSALEEGKLTTWRVNAHKSKITPGDKVILWASGDQRGCYALAEVDSEVFENTVNEDEAAYYTESMDDESYNQVQLRITHNLANNPITEDQVNSEEILSELSIGNQGTNFTATQEEYETLVELAEGACDDKWNKLVEVVSKIDDEDAVRKFFATVKHVLNKFELRVDDEITYASAITRYVQFTIGSRYVTHIERKKGKVIQGFYVDNDHLEELKAKLPSLKISDKAAPMEEGEMTWVYMSEEDVTIEDFFEGIDSLAKKGIEGQSKSQFRSIYPDKHNPWIGKVATDNDLLDKLLKGEKMAGDKKQPEVDYSLNTIFYGPPGTGKTYMTINRAAEIVEGRKIKDYDEAKKIFNSQLGDTIEFITFHQNYSYEDFIQGLRPETEHSNELLFERVDGVFKKLADRALKNWKASEKPQTKKEDFEKVFNDFIEPLIEGGEKEIEVEMKRVSYHITNVTDRFIDFRKASGGTAHSLNIETLKKMYEEESVEIIRGLKSYYTPLLHKLLEMGKSLGEKELTARKNYVIVIDEINRANISRVFGELITLIESDKRYGHELHIPAKLPSGEVFSVPDNLYLIGTMNTADKSIALLDIALRRRFEFEAMYPKYVIKDEVIHDVDVLEKINTRIKDLKGHDFQIGHSYFMKNDVTLQKRMNRKVIPLLLEYFMNDEKEVRKILSYAGLIVKEGTWPLEITGRA